MTNHRLLSLPARTGAAVTVRQPTNTTMFKSLFLATLATLFLGFSALADEIQTPALGLTALNLGGGQALLDLSNPNVVTIDGHRSSTFKANISTNGITNNLVRFVDGQRAFVTFANPGTNQNASVTFADTGDIYFVPTNNPVPVIIEVSYVDGSYRTRSLFEPLVRQLTIGTNMVQNWPTQSPATNAAVFVTSNNVVFLLTTTLNTRTFGATNKLGP